MEKVLTRERWVLCERKPKLATCLKKAAVVQLMRYLLMTLDHATLYMYMLYPAKSAVWHFRYG